ncbi:MAG TPA: DUF4928 family protein [Gemmataceae bacterium]|nr:DUF4928 family protein [Gemmataceae bacterium]
MTPREKALAEFRAWYESLPRPRTAGSAPAKGSIAVGLVLLERLKSTFDLNLASHLAPGGAQIPGASDAAVKNILAGFGEARPFVSEGGRTNRGTPAIAQSLLNAIQSADLEALNEVERQAVLHELQALLVDKVREFHNREHLKPVFDPARSTRQFMSDFLALAEETGKHGPLAQYLVGAKLQLRFPQADVRNESYSVADDPSSQPGDFVVEDTTFHVTVAPTPGHFEQCKRNLQEGRRVFLLVPDSLLAGARQNAELAAPGRIAVESIESFISNFIELKAQFSAVAVERILQQLCEHFNTLVARCAPDEWLTLEMTTISDRPLILES